MTDASVRAREILDAIERDAGGRRDALTQERRALPSLADVVRREAMSAPPAPVAPADVAPPPAHPMAVASPIIVPLPRPADLVPGPQELDALLKSAIEAAPAPPPVAAPAPTLAPAAPAPPTEEAARLLELVDRVVAQTKRVQERVELLDAAVNDLGDRLGLEEAELAAPAPAPAPAAAKPATPAAPPAQDEPDLEPPEALEELEATDVPPTPAVEALRTARPPAAADAPSRPQRSEAPVRSGSTALPTGARSDGARLVGIEMAVAGYSRREVEHRLVREYGLTDPKSILDDVFGAGSDGDSRMPWGAV